MSAKMVGLVDLPIVVGSNEQTPLPSQHDCWSIVGRSVAVSPPLVTASARATPNPHLRHLFGGEDRPRHAVVVLTAVPRNLAAGFED